jgi:hypothetical protein
MADPGDIWQRYDAKVVQVQLVEARLAAVERELQQVREERDHWANVCRDLGKKLSVARSLAERLRNADRGKARPDASRGRRPAELSPRSTGPEFQVGSNALGRARDELDRAREVLGLVLTALTKALDDDEVEELGRKLRHHAGGKLLHSITRGSLTLVPVDGRYLVDRLWLEQLDIGGLRRELDVAAQSGIYALPDESLTRGEASQLDLDVDIEEPEGSVAGLPPPPLSASESAAALPPLLSALPDESDVALARGQAPSVPTPAAALSGPRPMPPSATPLPLGPLPGARAPDPARPATLQMHALRPTMPPTVAGEPAAPTSTTRATTAPLPTMAPARLEPPVLTPPVVPSAAAPPRLDDPARPAAPRPPEPEAPRPPAADTVRTANPTPGALIPNLRIGRLIKNPGAT